MFSYSQRNTIDQELLDQPGISAQALHLNMAELDTINNWLGGHEATLYGLSKLITDKSRIYTIVDVGCGGGDTLRAVQTWANSKGFKVKLIGIDISQDILDYARARSDASITYIKTGFEELTDHLEKPDILVTSLFMHHLFERDLLRLLWLLDGFSKVGWVINDLHRHPLAYYGIKLLTILFSRSYLVKHDAPLSVARGFSRKELFGLLETAKVRQAEIKWIWAFRWCVYKQNPLSR